MSSLNSYQLWLVLVAGAIAIAVYLLHKPDADFEATLAIARKPNGRTLETIQLLREQLPDLVFLRHDKIFADSVKSYWSAQAQAIMPACVARPRTEAQLCSIVGILSKALREKRAEPLHFAIRSGGHNPIKGMANVEAGVVIDLSLFNRIELSSDHSTIDIGTGARWMSVYAYLDAHGLAVAGGRASAVGVGGFMLGGMFLSLLNAAFTHVHRRSLVFLRRARLLMRFRRGV